MTTQPLLYSNKLAKEQFTPFLSLCIICGDAGVHTLERLLDSVCNRRTPLVDEVIICFNGKSEVNWKSRLERSVSPSVPISVFKQEWPGRFDVARAESFNLARGEWLLWLDTDDRVANPENAEDLKAISDVFRDYGQLKPSVPVETSKSLTLNQWLQTLPSAVNCILAPYNYTEDETGAVLVRQLMKRIVRRNAFQWHSVNGLHEQIIAKNGENAVTNLGFLVRHAPSEDAATRTKRNREVIQNIAGDSPKDARHAFDIATLYIIDGDWEKADAALRIAISIATNLLDAYRYRLARAEVISKRKLESESPLQEIFAAIQLLPDHPEAYFLATEAFFSTGQWKSCVTFFEIGRGKAQTPGPFDQPLMTFVQPRVQASLAYAALGEPAKGRALLTEVETRYADSPLVKDARAQLEGAAEKKAAVDGLIALAKYLKGEDDALALLKRVQNTAVRLRGVGALAEFQEAMANPPRSPPPPFAITESMRSKLPVASPWSDAPSLDIRGVAFNGPVDSERLVNAGIFESAFELEPGRFIITTPKSRRPSWKADPSGASNQASVSFFASRSLKPLCIAFYAPIAMDAYGPEDTETRGLGGSEGSVIYLARELVKLGHYVEVYLPGRSSIAFGHDGVTYYPLQRFDASVHYDAVIACRAPWLGREPCASPIFAWHQDNGYANPWMWSDEVVSKLAGNLFVSQWAMESLSREAPNAHALRSNSRSLVLGNGLCESDFKWPSMKVERAPRRVLYASDPSRGLSELLDTWPEIHAEHPDAELFITCGFRVSLTIAQASPGIPQLAVLTKLATRMNDPALAKMGVATLGWISHPKLRELIASCGIYAYPGGPMPEGYGVALAQAQAGGCDVVYPDAGALPEILHAPGSSATRPAFAPGGFKDALQLRMRNVMTDAERLAGREHLLPHQWNLVAEKLITYLIQVLS